MIVTEEEAKKKRCQESFGDGWTTPDGKMATAAGPMHAVVASPAFCIGSACMAWRWHRENIYREGAAANEFDVEVRVSDSAGYCGKAGRP